MSEGALCIFMPPVQQKGKKKKKKNAKEVAVPPLMLVKSDGGYNYDTTDMACAKYRLKTENCNRIVYITDSGQAQHFEKIFIAAEMAGWYDPKATSMDHMSFGLV